MAIINLFSKRQKVLRNEVPDVYKYDEIPGGDHGSVINTGMPDIFAFFNAHTKPVLR